MKRHTKTRRELATALRTVRNTWTHSVSKGDGYLIHPPERQPAIERAQALLRRVYPGENDLTIGRREKVINSAIRSAPSLPATLNSYDPESVESCYVESYDPESVESYDPESVEGCDPELVEYRQPRFSQGTRSFRRTPVLDFFARRLGATCYGDCWYFPTDDGAIELAVLERWINGCSLRSDPMFELVASPDADGDLDTRYRRVNNRGGNQIDFGRKWTRSYLGNIRNALDHLTDPQPLPVSGSIAITLNITTGACATLRRF